MMSAEAIIGILITVQIGLVAGFVHHLYQCRNVQKTLGRILERLGMDE
jgi:hypothetical protein